MYIIKNMKLFHVFILYKRLINKNLIFFMIKIAEKIKVLKEGEKIPLCYDECFKIMFENPKRLEPLTLLLSKILDVEYEALEEK